MSYRLIETYLDQHEVVLGDQTLPAVCLVEDDDAMRILVVPQIEVRAADWARASAAGAAALLVAETGFTFWITAERFMASRSENAADRTYAIPVDAITPIEGNPTPNYVDMVHEVEAATPALNSAGFVHLHAHSDYSPLDGFSMIEEMVEAAVADGQGAMAVTDHGYCSGHPHLMKHATDAGVKPIFGLEAYFVPDRFARGPQKLILPDEPEIAHPYAKFNPEFLLAPRSEWTDEERERMARWEQEKREAKAAWETDKADALALHELAKKAAKDYWHLVLWAMDDEGLRNLWAMSTEGFLSGFYGKPRIDWDTLERLNKGVMCSTACLRGPVNQMILRDDYEAAQGNLARLQGIFGDRLYAEIHTNQLPDQIKANQETISLANDHGIPTIAVVDAHYPCADDQHAHQVWLAAQTGGDLYDDKDLFAGAEHYHMMGVDEVRSNLSYLPDGIVAESIANTVDVADRCSAALRQKIVLPIYTKPGNYADDRARIEADISKLVKLALGTPEDGYANWYKHCGGTKRYSLEVYQARFEREMKLLIEKGFCGYYLMEWRQVSWAKSQGCLIGPGRGSGGGSLVAYLLGITAMDPVEADLLFERFLTEGRDEPPDFDVDYPTSWRERIQDFCVEEWGEDHTARVGTHTKLKSKGVFKDLARIFSDQVEFKDFAEISKIIDRAEAGTAGKGLTWDELWAQHGDELEPYQEKYPDIFKLAERMRGRLKTYARHAAGMVIAPDETLTGNLPLRTSENSNQPITQFDMDALTLLGYIKFDLLTLRTLDTLQACIDLIYERRGIRINVYDWVEEYNDPQVWDEICAGNTKGIFQIETPDGTRMTKKFQPRSIHDLADVITLVRPGPKRSGLTDSYLRRKDGYEEISLPDPRLADVLEPTQGCIIYQEQVMTACQVLGGYTLTEADAVRRILGKKKTELIEAAGQEFIPRCIERGMAQADVEHLWTQLGEFAKYSFNKSHAWAYAMMGHWTAWFKFHYPVEFLTAVLSTVDKVRIPEFVNEARRMGYKVLPPDINESRGSFTATDVACRFGFEAIDGVGEAASNAILEAQPYTSFEDFMERKGKPCNLGHVKKMAAVGVFDSIHPNRRALVERLEWEDSDESTRCVMKDDTVRNHGLPCTYDWDEEPVEIGKSGRPKKRKPPPKRCTRACRRYTAPERPNWDDLPPYSDMEVRNLERDLLGIYLSSTPFDRLDPDDLIALATGTEVDNGPHGWYSVAAIITRAKPYTARNGEMGFLTLMAQDIELDCVAFHEMWTKNKKHFKPGMLCLAEVKKTSRGVQLGDTFIPLPEETPA